MPLPTGRFQLERHRAEVMSFLFDSSDSEEDVGGECSSDEAEVPNTNSVTADLENSDRESDIEPISGDEEIDEMNDSHGSVLLGRDKVTAWSLREPKTLKTKRCNIVRENAGSTDTSKHASGIAECWSLFVSDNMIEAITTRTNEKILLQRDQWTDTTQVPQTSETEIKALIGLLYLAGVMRSNRQNLEDLWSTDGTGIEISSRYNEPAEIQVFVEMSQI